MVTSRGLSKYRAPTGHLRPHARADELLDAGDLDGRAVWTRIRAAVLELLKPGDGETVH